MKTAAQPFATRKERLIADQPTPSWLTGSTQRIRTVMEAVADEFFIDPIDIISGKNTADANEARMVCYWIMSKVSRLTNIQIAHRFSRHDHSTVGNGISKTEERRTRDPIFREMTDAALLKSECVRPRLAA